MEEFDVVIIGGGVVGCSVLFELTSAGYQCCLLEKNNSLVAEASAGNGGILHSGFDAPEGSLELKCIKLSQQRIHDVMNKTGIPFKNCGAVMVAWTSEEAEKLDEVLHKCEWNGIEGVRELSLSELYQQEPHLANDATRSLWIEKEAVLDPCLLPLVLTHSAVRNGAKVQLNQNVTHLRRPCGNSWEIHTQSNLYKAKCIINAAGLWGDIVDQFANNKFFRIKPRKGQWLVYDKSPSPLINSIILPVPSERTKGILLFKSVYNNVIVGPTADETNIREKAAIDPCIRQKLLKIGNTIVPELSQHRMIGEYTGTRPATEYKDYIIEAIPSKKWITVGGIRSTGVSACLGIAEYVHDLMKDSLTIEPEGKIISTLEHIPLTITSSNTLNREGTTYNIVHPITKFGAILSNKL